MPDEKKQKDEKTLVKAPVKAKPAPEPETPETVVLKPKTSVEAPKEKKAGTGVGGYTGKGNKK